MSLKVIESTTVEKIPVVITTPADPTGNTVAFAVTTTTTQPTSWQNGTWSTSWSATTGEATALTPVVGDGQTIDLDPGTDYDLWARWTIAGGETPVRQVGRIRVT